MFWSTYLDSVCANLTVLFSGQQIHRPKRIDVSNLVATFVATKYQTELGSRLANIPLKGIDEHWLQLHDAMELVSKVTCGFAKRPDYKLRVSLGSSQLIKDRRSTPGGREFDYK